MNTKNNIRFQVTDQKIRKVFLEELEKNGIEKVSVSTICQKVGINRSSFYAHFEDVYDILDHLSEDLGREVYEMFRKADASTPAKMFGKEELTAYLDYIFQYKSYFRIYFQAIPLERLGGSFERTFSELIFPNLILLGESDPSVGHLHFTFFKAGFFAVIKQWLVDDCQKSPGEVAQIVMDSIPG